MRYVKRVVPLVEDKWSYKNSVNCSIECKMLFSSWTYKKAIHIGMENDTSNNPFVAFEIMSAVTPINIPYKDFPISSCCCKHSTWGITSHAHHRTLMPLQDAKTSNQISHTWINTRNPWPIWLLGNMKHETFFSSVYSFHTKTKQWHHLYVPHLF